MDDDSQVDCPKGVNSSIKNYKFQQNDRFCQAIVCIWVTDPAKYKSGQIFKLSLHLHCHFVIILNTISKLEVKFSARYITSILYFFQVSQVLP